MSWWSKLKPHQRDLLQRIADGHEPVTSREPRLAPTVYALQSRRLVTTPRSEGVWTAVITDAGRFYLEHDRYAGSNPPRPTKPDQAPVQPATEASKRRSRRAEPPQGPATANDAEEPIEAVTDTQQLQTIRPHRITVPDDFNDPHPVVVQLQRDEHRLVVSETIRPRPLRLLQGIAAEAERRGHEVRLPADDEPGFVVFARGSEYRLVMTEEWETVENMPGSDELTEDTVYSWQRIRPRPVHRPSGRLVLEIVGDTYLYGRRPRRWADRRRWRLDDKLGAALVEVEERAAFDKQARLAAENAAADRRREWDVAMESARLRYAEAHYRNFLDRQVEAWQRVVAIRAYVVAAEQAAAGASPPTVSPAMRRWLDWIAMYADAIDPLRSTLEPPQPPRDPDPEDLRPFLRGWSPYGPHRHRSSRA